MIKYEDIEAYAKNEKKIQDDSDRFHEMHAKYSDHENQGDPIPYTDKNTRMSEEMKKVFLKAINEQ